jgi:hypothetical protein
VCTFEAVVVLCAEKEVGCHLERAKLERHSCPKRVSEFTHDVFEDLYD